MEVGQQPCLWSSLKLKLMLDNRGPPEMDPVDLPTPPYLISIGRTNDLLKVLNMGRLQAIEQFTLLNLADWMDSGISWQEFVHFLQITPPVSSEALSAQFFPHPSRAHATPQPVGRGADGKPGQV